MPVTVLLIVLAGAVLHASWNLLVKAGRDARLTIGGVYICAGALAALALPFLPAPARASWAYLAISTCIEVFYGVLVAAAYRVGDLSLAYPLMRGTAPLLVAIASGVLVGEPLSAGMWSGVLLVSCGILLMVFDARPQGHSLAAVRLALVNGFLIAAYTTVDGLGTRVSGQPLTYGAWIFVLTGVPWLLWWVLRHRRLGTTDLRRLAPAGIVGGACSFASYTAALWAMTRAPVAAVAAVRETSILFATVLGVIVLRERITVMRALAAGCIVVGVWWIRAG
jgi:drug/metabolite transporter (DMT)-like permease